MKPTAEKRLQLRKGRTYKKKPQQRPSTNVAHTVQIAILLHSFTTEMDE